MKSYGRAPTFLAMTGYEQVRSVVAELAGDHDAAEPVQLAVPDTGVCGGAGLFDAPAAAPLDATPPPIPGMHPQGAASNIKTDPSGVSGPARGASITGADRRTDA
jgi:hypothetical protein